MRMTLKFFFLYLLKLIILSFNAGSVNSLHGVLLTDLCPEKCSVLSFFRTTTCISHVSRPCDALIPQVSLSKDLGVLFDPSLSFKQHQKVINQANNWLFGYISRCLKSLYYCWVRPWNIPISSGLLSKYLCSKGLRGSRDDLQRLYFVGHWVISLFPFPSYDDRCALSCLSWNTASRSLRLLSRLACCFIRSRLLPFCLVYIVMLLVALKVIVFVFTYLYVVYVLFAMSHY